MTMSRENRRWGTERIRGELHKLGLVVSNRSIRRYRWHGPVHSPSQAWRTFLHNHASSLLGGRPVYRAHPHVQNAVRAGVYCAWPARAGPYERDTNPTAAWVWRQVIRGHTLGYPPAPPAARSGCRLRERLPPASHAHRDRRHRHAGSVAACERDRRTRHWHPPARVPGPHDRARPAAPSVGTERIRELLQRGSIASRPGTRDAQTESTPNHRLDPVAPGATRVASRLRARRLSGPGFAARQPMRGPAGSELRTNQE